MNVTEMDAAFCKMVTSAARRYVKMKRLSANEGELDESVREAMSHRDATRSEEVLDNETFVDADNDVKRLVR